MKITVDDFYSIAENFRNKEIWKLENDKWYIDNFIVENWEWL